MSFIVPPIDWREEGELKEVCLVRLHEANAQIFKSLAKVMYAWFRDQKEYQEPNSFEAFCALLAMAMLDAPSQRIGRSEVPKPLAKGIWEHLRSRGRVKGYLQDSVEKVQPLYEVFARFVAVRAFETDDPELTEDELQQARRSIGELTAGRRELRPVQPNPFGREGTRC